MNNDNNTYFLNYGFYSPSSVNDSFIIFDFGSKQIDLHSYFIRSNGGDNTLNYMETFMIINKIAKT